MKYAIAAGAAALLSFIVMFVHPVELISDDTTRTAIYVGLSMDITDVESVGGGHKCYVNSHEYFWLPTDTVLRESESEDMSVTLRPFGPDILYRSDL